MSRFFIGVDLGQSHDPTALVILEKHKPDPQRRGTEYEQRARYECRHIERLKLGTSYPRVVEHVKALISCPPLTQSVALVLDYTGVGRPVADMFKSSRLSTTNYYITIHGGDSVQRDGGWYRVPQRDLIGAAQVLLQSQRLTIAKSLPEANTLIQELLNFRIKINPETAHDSYSAWRENQHDDLVFALSLACWMGEHQIEVCVL